MKKFIPFICAAVCACALFMVGCSCSINVTTNKHADNASNQAPLPVRETKSLYNVMDGSVGVGENHIVVTLQGNPTTGYEWTSAIDGKAVVSVSEQYESTSKSSVAAGGGGYYTFTYEGAANGTSTINLKYARSWEKSNSDKWIKIEVTTKNGQIADTVTTCSDGSTGESHA